jgi:hypothetical protein
MAHARVMALIDMVEEAEESKGLMSVQEIHNEEQR